MMGMYLNPGNEGFEQIVQGLYVDKTGLIDSINRTIGTTDKMTCVSRPRRFGKSYAAKMLCAYYDKSCDSRALFDGLAISQTTLFKKYLNRYHTIYLDVTRCLSQAALCRQDILTVIQSGIIDELRAAFPAQVGEEETYLPNALFAVSAGTGEKFIIIIDEWDAIFRESKEDERLQREYLLLLRGLFKGGMATDKTIAAAYMTGILPIKKYGTQSALTDFREYSMTAPDELSEYVGFTESEVQHLCEAASMDFEEMKRWYDGYSFRHLPSVYNPHSVISAIQRRTCRNYWTRTETYESLQEYIGMNFDGLKDDVIVLLGGEKIPVRADKFQNDLTSFASKDEVIALLIHLGYLAYDEEEQKAYIPNREVAEAFEDAVEDENWSEVSRSIRDSSN